MKYIFIFLIVLLSLLHAEKTYYPTGELKTEKNYKNGKLHGLKKVYYKSGKLRHTLRYENGKRLEKVYYYSTGIKPSPTKITNTNINVDLLSYGYKQEQDNSSYRAYLAYDKVCDSGNLNGCFYLGLGNMISEYFYDAKLKAKINGYPEKAITMWTKECENGDMLSCTDLARLYRSKGKSDKATKIFKIACGNGEMKGCMGITGRYGFKKKDTKPEFMKNYKKACDKGELNACYWLGRSYSYTSNFKESDIIYEKACNDGEMKSCDMVALKYEHRIKDYIKANQYYTKACNNEYMFSCATMTRIQVYLPEEEKTSNLVEKACEIGLGFSCISLGLGAKSESKAVEYFKKGCVRGDTQSCDWIEWAKDREYK